MDQGYSEVRAFFFMQFSRVPYTQSNLLFWSQGHSNAASFLEMHDQEVLLHYHAAVARDAKAMPSHCQFLVYKTLPNSVSCTDFAIWILWYFLREECKVVWYGTRHDFEAMSSSWR